MRALWVAVALLTAVVLLLALAVVVLAREIGLLSLRLPPAPALDSKEGPAVGDVPPRLYGTTPTGEAIPLTEPQVAPVLLIFLSSRCRPCVELASDMPAILRDWPGMSIRPVVSGPLAEVRKMTGLGSDIVRDEHDRIKDALGILGSPFAMLMDTSGQVAARGVVNTREMVSSLIEGNVRTGYEGMWFSEPSEASNS